MSCFFCKGQTRVSTTKFIVALGSCVVIVMNVPAQVCQQCGEASFDNETANQLEKIVNTIKRSMMSEVAIVEYSQAVA